MDNRFIISIDRFKPHTFQAKMGEGLFISHSHDYDELTFIMAGEGYYSSTKQNIKVSGGDLILIPKNLHHGFVCTEPWQGISIHFHYDKLPIHCQSLFTDTVNETNRIRKARLSAEDSRWAEISLLQLEKEWKLSDPSTDSYNVMRIALETTLLMFQRNKEDLSASEDNSNKEIIREVIKEIHANYSSNLTVNELAARHFLSASNLRKKFIEQVRISPKQYIINLRLLEAKRLLQQTDKAIERISTEVGFTTSSRFYNYFVKAFGLTPSEWRNIHK